MCYAKEQLSGLLKIARSYICDESRWMLTGRNSQKTVRYVMHYVKEQLSRLLRISRSCMGDKMCCLPANVHQKFASVLLLLDAIRKRTTEQIFWEDIQVSLRLRMNKSHSGRPRTGHSATHCNTLQRTATPCNTLQHTTTHHFALKNTDKSCTRFSIIGLGAHCNTLQNTAAHCSTLQHTAAHCSTLQHTAAHCSTLWHTATHCNTLQYTAANCNTVRHTARHCKALQHTATHRNTLQHTVQIHRHVVCVVLCAAVHAMCRRDFPWSHESRHLAWRDHAHRRKSLHKTQQKKSISGKFQKLSPEVWSKVIVYRRWLILCPLVDQ